MREDLYKRFGLKCNNFKRTFQKGRNGGPMLDKGKTIKCKGFGLKHNNFIRVSQKGKNGKGFVQRIWR